LYYDRSDWAHALEYYRRVLAALPKHFEALIQAGNAARFLGDEATAAGYYADAGRVRPDSWIPPYNLACLRAINGHPHAALVSLGTAVDRGLGTPSLLEQNEDFTTVRALPGWGELLARARTAATSRTRAP